jgi:hypothetical protein
MARDHARRHPISDQEKFASKLSGRRARAFPTRSTRRSPAHKTLRNLRWFEVIRTSGHIEDGKVRHYQVTLSIGFTMEEPG